MEVCDVMLTTVLQKPAEVCELRAVHTECAVQRSSADTWLMWHCQRGHCFQCVLLQRTGMYLDIMWTARWAKGERNVMGYERLQNKGTFLGKLVPKSQHSQFSAISLQHIDCCKVVVLNAHLCLQHVGRDAVCCVIHLRHTRLHCFVVSVCNCAVELHVFYG